MEVLNFYKEGLKIPEGAIYIGRYSAKHGLPQSKYHNPIKLQEGEPRGSTMDKYRKYLWGEIKAGRITVEELANLYGTNLVCYCKPKPCHGGILMAAIKWAKEEMDNAITKER